MKTTIKRSELSEKNKEIFDKIKKAFEVDKVKAQKFLDAFEKNIAKETKPAPKKATPKKKVVAKKATPKKATPKKATPKKATLKGKKQRVNYHAEVRKIMAEFKVKRKDALRIYKTKKKNSQGEKESITALIARFKKEFGAIKPHFSRDLKKDSEIKAKTSVKRKSPTYGKKSGAKKPFYYEYRMNRRDNSSSPAYLEEGGELVDISTFGKFYDYLYDNYDGDWDNVNSEDIIRMYIDDMRNKDVDVDHIEKALDSNPSSTELYEIWLGNSMNTPRPIENELELLDALGIDEDELQSDANIQFAKGGEIKPFTIKFKHKGKEHKHTFTPDEPDWWTSFESNGNTYDVHYDEDYKHIVVYEYSDKGTDYDNTVYKKELDDKELLFFAKGGQLKDKNYRYIPKEEVIKIVKKNGRELENDYGKLEFLSGAYISEKAVNEQVDKNQLKMFKEGGKMPKDSVYIKRNEIDYITIGEDIDEPEKIEGKYLINGFWLDPKLQKEFLKSQKPKMAKGGDVEFAKGGILDFDVLIDKKPLLQITKDDFLDIYNVSYYQKEKIPQNVLSILKNRKELTRDETIEVLKKLRKDKSVEIDVPLPFSKGGEVEFAKGGTVKNHLDKADSHLREVGTKLYENKNPKELKFRQAKNKFDDSVDDLFTRRELTELGYAKGGEIPQDWEHKEDFKHNGNIYKIYLNTWNNTYVVVFKDRVAPAFKTLKEAKDYIKDGRIDYAKGGLLSRNKRYTLELAGLTGLREKAVEEFISENKLKEEEVLNIIVGLGRQQIKSSLVLSAYFDGTKSKSNKELLKFAKSEKAMRLSKGGEIEFEHGGEMHGTDCGCVNCIEIPIEELVFIETEDKEKFLTGGEIIGTLGGAFVGYKVAKSVEWKGKLK